MSDVPKGPWGLTKNDIISIIGAIFSGIAMLMTTCNNFSIDRGNRTLNRVEVQQGEQLQKTQDIHFDLESVQKKADVIEHKAAVIDSKLPRK